MTNDTNLSQLALSMFYILRSLVKAGRWAGTVTTGHALAESVPPRVRGCPRVSMVSTRVGAEPPQRDGHPEGEAAPALGGDQAGQVRHPPQPVADRVRMDEKHPPGRLQREPLLQVGHDGLDQGGPAGKQRLVHVLDE